MAGCRRIRVRYAACQLGVFRNRHRCHAMITWSSQCARPYSAQHIPVCCVCRFSRRFETFWAMMQPRWPKSCALNRPRGCPISIVVSWSHSLSLIPVGSAIHSYDEECTSASLLNNDRITHDNENSAYDIFLRVVLFDDQLTRTFAAMQSSVPWYAVCWPVELKVARSFPYRWRQ